jgi:hypothetical protein
MELFLIWLLLAAVGYVIGAPKDREWAGFFLGLLLGPIGWLIVALSAPKPHLRCPHCGGAIAAGYPVCKNCGRDLRPPEPAGKSEGPDAPMDFDHLGRRVR